MFAASVPAVVAVLAHEAHRVLPCPVVVAVLVAECRKS
jgi:hypothetical protein